jgi:hypothetical protein
MLIEHERASSEHRERLQMHAKSHQQRKVYACMHFGGTAEDLGF